MSTATLEKSLENSFESSSADIAAHLDSLRARRTSIERHSRTLEEDNESIRIARGQAIAGDTRSGLDEMAARAREIVSDIEANRSAIEVIDGQIVDYQKQLEEAEGREARAVLGEAIDDFTRASMEFEKAFSRAYAEEVSPKGIALRDAIQRLQSTIRQHGFSFNDGRSPADDLEARRALNFFNYLERYAAGHILPAIHPAPATRR
jgi:hypothetical protein